MIYLSCMNNETQKSKFTLNSIPIPLLITVISVTEIIVTKQLGSSTFLWFLYGLYKVLL